MWQDRKGAVHTWHLYELKQHCKAEWDKIPPQWYELLIKSYRKPSLQVTAAKSGSVSYWIMGGISFLTALNRVVLKLSLMTHTWMNHYGKEEPTALINSWWETSMHFHSCTWKAEVREQQQDPRTNRADIRRRGIS